MTDVKLLMSELHDLLDYDYDNEQRFTKHEYGNTRWHRRYAPSLVVPA
ncbi:MAG: hypothetical protein JRF65_12215 [Deltaproteobacteria bacterium]|nr:hypothetical protein [Deltaproteobacteria bacterium]